MGSLEKRCHLSFSRKRGNPFFLSLLILFVASTVFASRYYDYPGFHVSPHGLMLSKWTITGPSEGPSPQLNHPQGKPVEAAFTLTNVADRPILLNKMYVACRFYPKAENPGRVKPEDFGLVRGVLLNPGESKTLYASFVLNQAGTWRFWPGYQVGTAKGPMRWHDVSIRVEAARVGENQSGGSQVFSGKAFADGLQLIDFRLVTPMNPRVGAYAEIDFSLMNASPKPITFAPDGLYVSARVDLPTDIEDFGYKSMQSVTLQPGASIHIHAARKMDKPGLWFFWPGYKIFGGNTVPFKWHDLDVVVH